MKSRPKLICIVGPTSSGKTSWAKKLAHKFNSRVISADSRQIYKGMDIGTNKDKSFKQDLIDIIEPIEKFTVHDYQRMANNLLNQYFSMRQIPIVAGGTGLYIYALIYGYELPGLKVESERLREKLGHLSEEKLFEMLKNLDPGTARKIDIRNHRRVIRALEVTILSKQPFSRLQKKKKPSFDPLVIGIKVDRGKLYSKIDARVESQIREGLVEEVRNLIKKFGKNVPAFNTIGYKEIIDFFDGKIELKEAVEQIKNHTHAYARRQETWFRRNKDVHWVTNFEEAERLVNKFLR